MMNPEPITIRPITEEEYREERYTINGQEVTGYVRVKHGVLDCSTGEYTSFDEVDT